MTRPNYVPGDWANQLNNNQALAGAANRWVATTWKIEKGEFKVVNRPIDSLSTQPDEATRKQSIRVVFLMSCLAVLAPVGYGAWRQRQNRATAITVPPGNAPNPRVIECGIVLLLMLLLSPNSSRAHFCILYLPAFCIARLAVRRRAGVTLRVLLVLAAVAATLSIHIRLPRTVETEQVLLWVGVVMFAAVFLLMASTVALATKSKYSSSIARVDP